MMQRNTTKKKISSLAVLLIFIFCYLGFIPKAKAVGGVNPGGFAVGGTITAMYACTCPATAWMAPMLLYVLGKPTTMSGTYTLSYTLTELRSNWMYRPGAGMMGTYIPGVQACWMYYGTFCAPFPTRGILTEIGAGIAP